MILNIGNRQLTENELYFIADIGANHDGDLSRAYRLIELAKESGADAAKFQNFKAQKIVSDYGFKNLQGTTTHQSGWKKSVFQTYVEASVDDEWSQKLKEKCNEFEIDYFTSPYDIASVDHADRFVDLYKIGSGDITWLEIIRHIGTKGKPVLLATGAASMNDVFRAMTTLQDITNEIVLMQCNTNYVADDSKIRYTNLNVLKRYAATFPNCLLGLSDHSFGHATVCGAVALGARVIEKHFTDDNDRDGPDHKFAMNPKTWRAMVDVANQVLASLGDGVKRVEENEVDSRVVQQRSLYTTRNLKIGEVLVPQDVEPLRPCPKDAIRPYQISELAGRRIVQDVPAGVPLSLEHLEIES